MGEICRNSRRLHRKTHHWTGVCRDTIRLNTKTDNLSFFPRVSL